MPTYQIVKEGILISSFPSHIKLYESSKGIIEENSNAIEFCINSIEKTKSAIKQVSDIEVPEKENFIVFQNDMLAFYELYCFFLNFSIDFSICSRELALATNKSEQIFFIKSIYIELYRYLERQNYNLGILKKLMGKTEVFIEYSKTYENFKKRYYEQIKDKRNCFFAHFNNESIQYEDYYRVTLNLDIEDESIMCSCFLEVQQLLSKIYLQISNQKQTESIINLNLLRERAMNFKQL